MSGLRAGKGAESVKMPVLEPLRLTRYLHTNLYGSVEMKVWFGDAGDACEFEDFMALVRER